MAGFIPYSDVRDYCIQRIETLRGNLERDQDESATALIRGEIKALRLLLSHFEHKTQTENAEKQEV